ncbi:ABC transporter substrate-binding protein [Catenuloplanes japonicus]|uniref:ABC transporter substrate-binding protein n=1 Tax=Catenuloplanes japonicus TaxID=33876 RepID=UPI0005277EA3|nr:extracellular solute-binding protein [Catenuloplanes japonicus]
MTLSRRSLLQLGVLGLAGAGLAACTSNTGSGGSGSGAGETALWYWGDGLSDTVIANAGTQFAGQTSLKPTKVGGDFKQKLTTTLASGQFIPDITGIKGEDMANFRANADKFADLNEYGFSDVAGNYLEWKVKQGSTPDGKVIGFPIDIGPTGMFYREDVFAQGGLPTDPAQVGTALGTWDSFFEAATQLKGKTGGLMVVNASAVFNLVVGQGTTRFIDPSNTFIGDQQHIRTAWDLAVKAVTLGVDAKTEDGSTDWNAGITKGSIPVIISAAWAGIDIRNNAPDTSGKWRVANAPGGPGNIGGSFLAVTKSAKNPQLAYDIVKWILSPENAAQGFADASLFPASPASYQMEALTKGDEFFGGQKTIDIFGPAAEKIPIAFEAPADAAVSAPFFNELVNVEQGKNAEEGWKAAVEAAKQIGQRAGVN